MDTTEYKRKHAHESCNKWWLLCLIKHNKYKNNDLLQNTWDTGGWTIIVK